MFYAARPSTKQIFEEFVPLQRLENKRKALITKMKDNDIFRQRQAHLEKQAEINEFDCCPDPVQNKTPVEHKVPKYKHLDLKDESITTMISKQTKNACVTR